MHYKFKAMQKILAAVGISNDFSQRPVFQKIKHITSVTGPSCEEIFVIHDEIKHIEIILMDTRNEEKNSTIGSKKVKKIMTSVNRQIIEAMEIYLSAWQKTALLHNVENRMNSVENFEENAGYVEKSEDRMNSVENFEENAVYVEKSENQVNIKKQEKGFLEEEYVDRYELSEEIMALAEKAEQMLCEIEKKIKDLLDDNPLES